MGDQERAPTRLADHRKPFRASPGLGLHVRNATPDHRRRRSRAGEGLGNLLGFTVFAVTVVVLVFMLYGAR